MRSEKTAARLVRFWIVVLIQALLSQVVTFIVSIVLFYQKIILEIKDLWLVGIIVLCFTVGIQVGGWVGFRTWLIAGPRLHTVRFLAALLGCALPFAFALLVSSPIEPGNAVYMIAVIGGLIGYHLVGQLGSTNHRRVIKP